MNCYLFPGCAQDPVTRALARFRESGDEADYFAAFPHLLEFSRSCGVTGHTVEEYCVRLLLDALHAADYFGDQTLHDYIEQDIGALFDLYFVPHWPLTCQQYDVLPPPPGTAREMPDGYRSAMKGMAETESPTVLRQRLAAFFRTYGSYGEAVYTAFAWDGEALAGIPHPDGTRFEQLSGLDYQKGMLLENTRSFLEGRPANDVLLVGGSGTGKSSCVKATLNHFAGDGLRLVEIAKQQIGTLPELMRALRGRRLKYIVYIDDLSFETADASYMGLKVALDGQVESRPENVLIYATSNRRHLVRESWKERGADDEVHVNDTRHEKMSLSERFGVHLYFSTLSQPEYFAVVELLLRQQGVDFNENIGKQAAAWAATNSGRSGRSARQFVNQYLAR